MDSIDVIVGGAALGYVLLINLFVAAMHAKAVLDRGEKIWFPILLPLYVGAAVGLVLDVLFNLTFGTVIFRELPREFTFTSRLKRRKHNPRRGRDRALWWCAQLNKFDPDHC